MFIALITYLGRGGYDARRGISFLEAIYYSTVRYTTGYGDIAPFSSSKAVTAFVVTPLRILFLIVLVGTTLELLTSASAPLGP